MCTVPSFERIVGVLFLKSRTHVFYIHILALQPRKAQNANESYRGEGLYVDAVGRRPLCDVCAQRVV
jgi:hypothetical protein